MVNKLEQIGRAIPEHMERSLRPLNDRLYDRNSKLPVLYIAYLIWVNVSWFFWLMGETTFRRGWFFLFLPWWKSLIGFVLYQPSNAPFTIHLVLLKTTHHTCFKGIHFDLFYIMNYFELNLLAMKTKKWFLIGTAIAGLYLFMNWAWTLTFQIRNWKTLTLTYAQQVFYPLNFYETTPRKIQNLIPLVCRFLVLYSDDSSVHSAGHYLPLEAIRALYFFFIMSFWPGRILALHLFHFIRSCSVTPGYFRAIDHNESPLFTV